MVSLNIRLTSALRSLKNKEVEEEDEEEEKNYI